MDGTERIGFSYGRTLTNTERAALACSAPILRRDYNGSVRFWGKVYGQLADYLICSITKGRFERSWVYSVDSGMTWHPSVDLNEEQQYYCDLTKGLFKGNPKYEYKYKEELPPEPEPIVEEKKEEEPEEEKEEEDEKEEDDDKGDEDAGDEKEEKDDGEVQEEEVQKKKPKKPKTREILISENIRLSHFLNEVDAACRIIPKDIHRGGLTAQDALLLENYLHDIPEGRDLYMDMPKGIWAIKKDPTSGIVVCNNLFFEGYTFYHVPHTVEYGQYYFGTGEKNLDLCFLLS
jgi:radial spoke head protein 9